MGRRRCVGLVGLVALALGFSVLTAACGSTVPSPSAGRSAAAAAASGPAGSGLPTSGNIVVANRAFSVTIPDGWTRVDIGPDTMSQIERIHNAALSSAEQSSLGNLVKRYQTAAVVDPQSVPLLAIRASTASDPAIGFMSIGAVPSSPTVSADQAETAILDQIRKSLDPKIQISTSHVIGPAGRFLRISYDAAIAGTTTNIALIAYEVMGPVATITVSCTTFGAGSNMVQPCEATALSIRFEQGSASPGPRPSPSR
jgi:hypothetical protein